MRARITAAATVVVVVALAILGVAITLIVESNLIGAARSAAAAQARSIAALAHAGQVAPVLQVDGLNSTYAQVVRRDGTVVAASPQLAGFGPIDPAAVRATTHESHTATITRHGESEDVEMATVPTSTPDGPVVVIAAVSLDHAHDTLGVLIGGLFTGLGIATVIAAAVTYLVVTRALKPVESIRNEVDRITSTDLARRVPVPETRDEIAHLAQTMNTMLDRLDAAAKQQRRFIADAAHEIRSPLASLRAQLDVALAHPEVTEPSQLVRDLADETARLQALTEDLLLLVRLDADTGTEAHLATIDFADLVRGRVAAHQRNSVRLETSLQDGVLVLGQEIALRRLVDNLLDNAYRHADSTVMVTLMTSGEDSAVTGPPREQATGGDMPVRSASVRLTIRNDGPGIPDADRERIFDRFVRLDDARDRDSGGTGLGLAIARDIVRLHRGAVAVDDVADGASFTVTVPRAPASS